jgi:hypothetical protein
MNDMQPGQVIVPRDSDNQPVPDLPEPQRPAEQLQAVPVSSIPISEPVAETLLSPIPAPQEPSQPIAVSEVQPQTTPAQEASAEGWQFRQEELAAPIADEPPLLDSFTWTASEFIAHEKTASWYAFLAVGALVLAALVYLISRDFISTGIVVFVAIMFGAIASRQPRTQEYSLNQAGLSVGAKLYNFQDFKTFSISEEGAIVSIVFMPLKRFMPPLTVYVAPDTEERVVDFLSAYLPFEQHKTDAIDGLLKRMRF